MTILPSLGTYVFIFLTKNNQQLIVDQQILYFCHVLTVNAME